MSTLKADTIVASDGSSPVTLTKQSAAKAWVSFNGSGTLAVRNSFNNASVTDNGTGDYSPAFTNNMNDDDYAVGGLGQRDNTYAANSYAIDISIKSATSHSTYITSSNFTIISMWAQPAEKDPESVLLNIHGDLA